MRKTLVLLTLAVVTVASAGCASRCRHLCRRGSPCFGTARVAPAAIAAPVAVAAPAPVPLIQRIMPQQVMPQQVIPQQVMPQQIVMPQMQCCPQPAPVCVPCQPCCPPCETGYMPGGYIGGGMIDGGCQDCGPTTTYNQGYLVPGSEIPQDVAPNSSGSQIDPGPTTPDA